MGATLESFCCSNENREETQDNNHNPNGSTITTINEASKNKLPSNKILPAGDINKFLETLLADFVAKNKEKIKENFYLDKKNKKKKKRSFC